MRRNTKRTIKKNFPKNFLKNFPKNLPKNFPKRSHKRIGSRFRSSQNAGSQNGRIPWKRRCVPCRGNSMRTESRTPAGTDAPGRRESNGAHRNSAEWSVPRESPETSLQSASFGAYGGLPRGLRHEEPRTKTEVRRERSSESERVGGKREKSVGRREGKKPAMEGKGKTKSSVRDSEPRSFNDKAKVKAKAQEQPIAKEEPKEEPKAEVTMQAAEPVRRNPNADAPPFLPREEMAMMYPMVRQPMVYMIPADYYPPMMVPMNDPNMNYNFMYNYHYPPMNH